MYRAGDKFLSGSALSHDKNCAAGGAGSLHPVVELSHRSTRANQSMKMIALLAGQRAGLTLKSLNTRSRSGALRAEVSIGQNDHSNMAELVERAIDARHERRRSRKGSGGAFLKQMHRDDQFGERYAAFREHFTNSANVGGEAIDVARDEILQCGVELAPENLEKFDATECAAVRKVQQVQFVPVLEYFVAIPLDRLEDGLEFLEFVFPQQMKMAGTRTPRRPAGRIARWLRVHSNTPQASPFA